MAEEPRTEAAVVEDLTRRATELQELNPADLYGVHVPQGHNYRILDLEQHRAAPARKRERIRLHDAESLIAYVLRHLEGDPGLAPEDTLPITLYADAESAAIVAVLNDSTRTAPGWLDHRAALSLRETPAWRHWIGKDGAMMSQVAFAEHLEDGVHEIVQPDGADLKEIALTLEGTSSARFKSAANLHSGARTFIWDEAVEARGGGQKELDVPRSFVLMLAPYEGAEEHQVSARLRFKVEGGALKLGYQLDRPDRVRRAAFDFELAKVAEATGLTMFRGFPPERT